MAALAALSGAALASDSVLRGASDVIDKRVIPRVVNSLATRLGDAGDWNSVAGDRVRVGPRAVVKLPYVVQGNDVLRWEFCVRAHDVRFSVSERRMASGGAVEVGLLPSATFAAARIRCPESIPRAEVAAMACRGERRISPNAQEETYARRERAAHRTRGITRTTHRVPSSAAPGPPKTIRRCSWSSTTRTRS